MSFFHFVAIAFGLSSFIGASEAIAVGTPYSNTTSSRITTSSTATSDGYTSHGAPASTISLPASSSDYSSSILLSSSILISTRPDLPALRIFDSSLGPSYSLLQPDMALTETYSSSDWVHVSSSLSTKASKPAESRPSSTTTQSTWPVAHSSNNDPKLSMRASVGTRSATRRAAGQTSPLPPSTSVNITTSREHTTMIITSKPTITIPWTLINDVNSTSTVLVTRPACLAEIPHISYLAWVPIEPIDDMGEAEGTDDADNNVSADIDTVDTGTASDDVTAGDELEGDSRTETALPRNDQGIVYTSIFSAFAGWDGVNSAKLYGTVTTVAYPTQFWDYAPQYQWAGSTIGAPASCQPDISSNGLCKGAETLRSHPVYGGTPTHSPAATQNDTFGLGYTPTILAYEPGPTDLEWFLSAFPDIVALRECETTIFEEQPMSLVPIREIGLTSASSAVAVIPGRQSVQEVDRLTEVEKAISVSVLTPGQPPAPPLTTITSTSTSTTNAMRTTSTFVAFTLQVQPAQSVAQSGTNGQSSEKIAEKLLDESTSSSALAAATALLLPAQILSAALQDLGNFQDDESQATLEQPETFTFGSLTVEQSQGVVLVNGLVLKQDASTVLGSDSVTTAVGLATRSIGDTLLWVGSSTTTLFAADRPSPAPTVLTFADKTITQSDRQLQHDSQDIQLGSSITLGSGSQTTVIAYATNVAGQTEIIVGTSTTILPASSSRPMLPIGEQTVTQSSDVYFIEDKTLRVGQSVTIGSGSFTTLVAVQTDSKGLAQVVVGSSTATVAIAPTPITTADLTLTPVATNAVVLGGKILTVGGSLTITGTLGITTLSLVTDSAGRLAIVEPSTTVLIGSWASTGLTTTSPIITAGLVVTPMASNAVMISGRTLTVGGGLTVTGTSGTTTLSLTTNSAGQLEIIESSTTIVLANPSKIGDHILAGLQPPASTNASTNTYSEVRVVGSSTGRSSGSSATYKSAANNIQWTQSAVLLGTCLTPLVAMYIVL